MVTPTSLTPYEQETGKMDFYPPKSGPTRKKVSGQVRPDTTEYAIQALPCGRTGSGNCSRGNWESNPKLMLRG